MNAGHRVIIVAANLASARREWEVVHASRHHSARVILIGTGFSSSAEKLRGIQLEADDDIFYVGGWGDGKFADEVSLELQRLQALRRPPPEPVALTPLPDHVGKPRPLPH